MRHLLFLSIFLPVGNREVVTGEWPWRVNRIKGKLPDVKCAPDRLYKLAHTFYGIVALLCRLKC